jgi:integron integrase
MTKALGVTHTLSCPFKGLYCYSVQVNSCPIDPGSPPKLLDRVRAVARYKHYSLRTEETYVSWIRRYILFHRKQHPSTLGADQIREFLTDLALRKNVSASTQNQALNAVVFLYREVLNSDPGTFEDFTRAKSSRKLPVVLSRAEVAAVLRQLDGDVRIVVGVLYGSGLRLMEALRLRFLDVDFDQKQIVVRNGKGAKDRITVLPERLAERLRAQMDFAAALHGRDVKDGLGEVWLPHALARKYPRAPKELRWQFIFPATDISVDPRSGKQRRHHIGPEVVQKAVREAANRASIRKHATPHTFRHSFLRFALVASRPYVQDSLLMRNAGAHVLQPIFSKVVPIYAPYNSCLATRMSEPP